MQTDPAHLYRKLPQVGELLQRSDFLRLEQTYSRELLAEALRSTLHDLRSEIKAGRHTEDSLGLELHGLSIKVARSLRHATRPSLRPVLNATGVILQTNLGRAPLSEATIQRMAEVARGYSNLEFDLETGERNRRDFHVERLILNIIALKSGQSPPDLAHKSAAVVNNCAAANFLALNTLAEGGEVLVSRGELVEIGGGFRVPDILRKSGAILREVGTTNRTTPADYEQAIGADTAMILKVHPSNYKVEGFTSSATISELAALSVPLVHDIGSGLLAPHPLLPDEPDAATSLRNGADLVTASGDKLLGGPQAGLILGDEALVRRLLRHPLARALRVDKLTLAALEATIAGPLPPVARFLAADHKDLTHRSERAVAALTAHAIPATVASTEAAVGGGGAPGVTLPSAAIALAEDLALPLRHGPAVRRGQAPAVVGRLEKGRLLLDLRSVDPADDDTLITAIIAAATG